MIWSELVERGNITIPDVIRVVHDNLPRRRVTREIHAFFRMILHRRSFRKHCDLFSRPEFRYIGDIEPAIFYKPFRPYFCKGLPIRKRIEQIYFHYETLGRLYQGYIRRLYSSGGIPVLTLRGGAGRSRSTMSSFTRARPSGARRSLPSPWSTPMTCACTPRRSAS